MIDYGLLAAKLSDIFSDLLWHLHSFLDSIYFSVLFPIFVVIITAILLIRNWRDTHIRHL
jgi:hypothetical protein